MGNRSHSKVAQLPVGIRNAVDDLLVKGITYEEVTAFLVEKGHEISRSAVGRYGKDFHSRLERLKLVRAQARAVTSQTDGAGLELEEATSQILLQELWQFLGTMDTEDGEARPALLKALPRLMTAVAQLQRSGVAREAFKSDMRKMIKAAAESVAKDAKAEGLSDEAVERIRKQILGVAA